MNEAGDATTARKRSRFFYVRVSILLFILFVVVLYAVKDLRSRRARNEWTRTVDVAVVVVHVRGQPAVDDEAIRAFRDRAGALEDRLAVEATRHRPGIVRPFRVHVSGPVEVAMPPPSPASDGIGDLTKQALALRSWLKDVDPRAGIEPDHWDTRIYVDIRRPASEERSFVEGQSEQDGRIGSISVELDPSMADTTWIVVTHELLHTLGASDKYDSSGRAKNPEGFVEPTRVPLYPQRYAEVMARNRPTDLGIEKIPVSLDELGVGEPTAREIGWIR